MNFFSYLFDNICICSLHLSQQLPETQQNATIISAVNMIVEYIKHLIIDIDRWLVELTFFGLLKAEQYNEGDNEVNISNKNHISIVDMPDKTRVKPQYMVEAKNNQSMNLFFGLFIFS